MLDTYIISLLDIYRDTIDLVEKEMVGIQPGMPPIS